MLYIHFTTYPEVAHKPRLPFPTSQLKADSDDNGANFSQRMGWCFHPNFAFTEVLFCLNLIQGHCMAYKLSVDMNIFLFRDLL